MPLTMMLRHILVAAASPTFADVNSIRMPNGAIRSTNSAPPAPPTSMGTLCP